MTWIGVEDIILIHSKIIQKSGGIDGIRDRSCLESAVAAPMQSFGGQDFSLPMWKRSHAWAMAWQPTMLFSMAISGLAP